MKKPLTPVTASDIAAPAETIPTTAEAEAAPAPALRVSLNMRVAPETAERVRVAAFKLRRQKQDICEAALRDWLTAHNL